MTRRVPTTPGYMKRITWKWFLIKHNLAMSVASGWHTLNLPFLLSAVLSSSLAEEASFLCLDWESAGDFLCTGSSFEVSLLHQGFTIFYPYSWIGFDKRKEVHFLDTWKKSHWKQLLQVPDQSWPAWETKRSKHKLENYHSSCLSVKPAISHTGGFCWPAPSALPRPGSLG